MANRRFTDNPRLDGLVGSEFIPLTSVAGGTEAVTGDPIAPDDDAGVTVDDIYNHFTDTDGTLAADSDDVLPSQKAVRTYVAASIAALAPNPFSIGLTLLADTSSTSDADPGAGNFRWNNATQASATVVYIDDVTHGGGASLTGIWAALVAGGFLYTQHPGNAAIWSINLATAVVDASGYAKMTIERLAGEGSFADNDPMIVTLEQGATGGGGPTVDLVGTPSNVSGTVTLDFGGASRYVGSITLGANVTTLAFANLPGAGKYAEYELHIAQDGTGGRTFAIPASHKALGGSDTAIALGPNAVTVLTASTVDTTWRYAMQESA